MGQVKVSVEAGSIEEVSSELVVVNLFKGLRVPGGATGVVDRAIGGGISRLIDSGDFKGKAKEVVVLYPDGVKAKRVAVVGLGERDRFDVHAVRDVGARLVKKARELGVRRVHTVLHGSGIGGLDARAVAQALAEGIVLGSFRFRRYKSKPAEDEEERELEEVVLVEVDETKVRVAREGARVGSIVAECANLAREWATLSGDDAWPERYGEIAERLAKEASLRVEVFDRAAIEAHKMGGLLGVSRGSAREPRFVVLEHRPKGAKGKPIVLVGKGITFDSGGISIKPAESMDQMKFDKSGACAVLATLRACALLDVPMHVVGLTAWSENMPSGSAYKPGDILMALNGKQIEIINTDAEGRLLLADCLSYAARYDPQACIELSTLTGGIVVALGNQCAGMFGNDRGLLDAVKAAGDRTRERVWEMPMYEEYGEMVKSKVADVKNSAGRSASAVTAAKFLENFVDGYPWVHLDIAGTAWNDGASPGFNEEITPGQATGVGVRLLVDYLRNVPAEAKPDPAPQGGASRPGGPKGAGKRPGKPGKPAKR